MLSLLVSLVFVNAAVPTLDPQAAKAPGDSAVACKSSGVMDAGYHVRVFYDHGTYLGFVHSETFAGTGREFFVGDLMIRRYPVDDRAGCYLQLTDSVVQAQRQIDIRVSSTGDGRIVMLEGKKMPRTPDAFTDLTCAIDGQVLQALGCLR